MMLGDEAKRFQSGKLCDFAPELSPSSMTWSKLCEILNSGYFKPQCRIANRLVFYEMKQNRMTVPQLSRELRRRAALCHPAVAEYDLITHFVSALRAPLRHLCGTDPTGAEWVDLNALVVFATVKEADLSYTDDAGARSAAASIATANTSGRASCGAGARAGSRAPSVGGKREQALVALMVAYPSALLPLPMQAAPISAPPMPYLLSSGLLAGAFTATVHTALAGTAAHMLLTLRRGAPPPAATPRGSPLTRTEELAGLMHHDQTPFGLVNTLSRTPWCLSLLLLVL